MAITASSAKCGTWDKYIVPMIWVATGFKKHDRVPMSLDSWSRLESVIRNKVLEHDLQAIISTDPNWAVPQLQADVAAAIKQMNLEPGNITFSVAMIAATEGGRFRVEELANVHQASSPKFTDLPVVGAL